VPVPRSTNRKWEIENNLSIGIQEVEGQIVIMVIYAFQCQHIQEGQNEIKEVTDVSLRSQK
jgi:hypothetical protein